MDKFDQFIESTQHVSCIVGNPATRDYVLLPLAEPFTEEKKRIAQLRGWRWFGLLGYLNGAPRVALDESLDEAALTMLAKELQRPNLVERVKEVMQARDAQPADEWAEFSSKLFALEDPRTDA